MFDVARFLRDCFTNPSGLVAFVRAFGVEPPNVSTAEKWFQRSSIPGEWFPMLAVLLELDRGGPVSLAGYLTEKQ